MHFSEALSTEGGHLLVILTVFMVGITLVVIAGWFGPNATVITEVGKETVTAALASLWTVMRIGGASVRTSVAQDRTGATVATVQTKDKD